MTAAQIFRGYVRFIGVGAIATAGIFGILKSLRVVAGSFAIAVRAFRQGEGGAGAHGPRHAGDVHPDRRGAERAAGGGVLRQPVGLAQRS